MFRLFGDKKTFLSFAIIGFLLGSGGLARLNRLRRQRQMPIKETSAMANFGRLLRPMWTIKRSGRNTNQRSSTGPAKESGDSGSSQPDLKKSLAKQNLTVDEYNRIYNRINSDERLREKALKLVEEERKKSSTDKS